MRFEDTVHENKNGYLDLDYIHSLIGNIVTPEQELIIAVIQSGVYEEDTEYLASETCEYHCSLIGLDYNTFIESALVYYAKEK